jgi:hypothetical protein
MPASAFRIRALRAEDFAHFFALDDDALHALGAARVVADSKPGYPCRVSLADADVGEELLLLPYEHHSVSSPYRAAGPIYVRRHAATADPAIGAIPDYVTRRLISVRAYDSAHWMINALVCEGTAVRAHIERLLTEPRIATLHLHNAKQGCYSCRVERA